MVVAVRGSRYRSLANAKLEEFILRKLRYLDFDQACKWYRRLERSDLCNASLIAFLGCNDRFYLLTKILGRKDALHPWIFNRCREVESSPDGHIDLWARYHFKAMDVNEPVPTPDGWRKHGDLRPGDELFGPNGKPCRVVARTPVFTQADCYMVLFDDGYSVVVSGDHLWTVDMQHRARLAGGGRTNTRSVTLSTAELEESVYRADSLRYRLYPRIPISAAVEFPEKKLPLDPFVLGAWLGDGTQRGTTITCGLSDADEMEKNISATGVLVRRRSHSNCVTLALGTGKLGDRTSSDVANALREIGVYNDKHVPHSYLTSSIEQRWSLLQGLMDTDGSCHKTHGQCIFCSANERLSDDVLSLCLSLGLRATQAKRHGIYKGERRPFWQVSFQGRNGHEPFRLKRKRDLCIKKKYSKAYRKIISIEKHKTIPVSCIQVDRADGLYLFGKNYIATHNSSIITNAGSIQEIICDPEITIAIFSVTKAIAHKFLSQIKTEFENNQKLLTLYHDVLWSKPRTQAPVWSISGGLVVKRVGNPKESTIEAHGLIDGQPTSRHYRLHIYDDVVTQDYMSDDMIEKTTLRWEMADNLGSHEGSRKWVAGTRYNFADTYGVMMDRKSFIPRIHPATHNGKLEGKPVFLSPTRWAEIKRDQKSTVSAQMLLNPAYGTDATFNPTWLKTFEVIPAVMNVYIMVDPSKGRGDRSDRTAIAVIGIDTGGNKYFIDGVRHRMRLSDRWRYMSQFYHKWRAHEGVQDVKVGYEIYGQQVDLEVIEEYQQKDNDYFKIEELNTPSSGPHSKNDRIERLEPDIKGGTFYLPVVVYHPDYAEISNGRAVWKPWLDEDDQRRDKRDEEAKYMVGQIIYRPLLGFTRLQRKVSQKRIVNPIRRVDENNKAYDVTRALIGEIQEHPFGHYKDLIDATSRIYDMDPIAPKKYDVASLTGVDDDFIPEAGLDTGFAVEDDFEAVDSSIYGIN